MQKINTIYITLILLLLPFVTNGQIMNVNGNQTLFISNGTILQVNGGIQISSNATVIHQSGATSYLNISGKFVLYGTYTQSENGRLTFNRGEIDTVSGNPNITIARVYIDKSNNNRVVLDPTVNLTISEFMMLLNSSFELVNSDLIILPTAEIYSSLTLETDLTTFNANKAIINSGSSVNPLLGGRLVRRFSNTSVFPIEIIYPIGTPGYYNSSRITLLANGSTLGANPEIGIKPVDREHPEVEVNDKSLTKYWVITSKDITMKPSGANVLFRYNADEVNGNEANYQVLYYSPSYNNPNGFWNINPGNDNDIVDFNERMFYSIKINSIDGDWTAGEPEVSQAIYYSRQNGNWDDPNTWSKVTFNGAVSNTAPNKKTDIIRIKGHTVTVSSQPAIARVISVESDLNTKLIINNSYYLTGDSLILDDSTQLAFAHPDGISAAPTMSGAIQTAVRSLSSNATYEFIGSGNQISGNGLPNVVQKVVINKNTLSDSVKLSKNISISNELVINQGALDLAAYTMDGISAGRTLTMNGGELITRTVFPLNYNPPYFTAGKITFDGIGNSIVPSSTSTPAVLQYNNLKIAGNTRSGNIIFPNSGLINVKDSLDISKLNFTNNTFKFLTDGSTIVFNKVGGIQDIPTIPGNSTDPINFLNYYNLILDSSGTKQLYSTSTPVFRILNDITLDNTANLKSNNLNMEIYGNWLNKNGATFDAGTNTVIMNSTVALTTKTITSRDTTANKFNNLEIKGAGIVKINDNIKIGGNLQIDTTSNFNTDNKIAVLNGNYTQNGGIHSFTTSTFIFSNTIAQNIVSTSNSVNFYNLNITNPQNVYAYQVGDTTNGVIVNNDLNLNSGNLVTHSGTLYDFVTVLGNVTRTGNGFVDGELRKNILAGATSKVYEVGFNKSYTPVTMNFTGTGGTAGLFGVLSDTVTTVTNPIKWSDATPTNILPTGSTMSPSKHVARQYILKVPYGSSFVLSNTREYNVTANYIAGFSPNGDKRNLADYSKFSARLRTATEWIAPFQYGTKPLLGTVTDGSVQFTNLNQFGALLVGEPRIITYYTRANGNWEDANNWSLQGYGGSPASSYPSQVGNSYVAFIGNNNTINMTSNKTLTNFTTDSAIVQVDSSGTLMMNSYILSGNGAFKLMKYGTLGIGDAAGIMQTTASGNVQTGYRNFNYDGHQRGTFIYTGGLAQTTGTGLPNNTDSIYKLIVNKTANTLTSNNTTLNILDSLWVKSGGFNFGTCNIYLYKSLRKGIGATIAHNNKNVYFRGGNKIYLKSDSYTEPINLYNVYVYKLYETGDIYLDSLTVLNIENSLTFETNNKVIINATDFSTANQPLYVQLGTSSVIATVTGANHINTTNWGGWIYGEVRKNIPIGDAPAIQFETGTFNSYAPYTIDFRTGSGSVAGILACKAIDGSHPRLYDSPPNLNPVNPNRNITVYWKVTKPKGSTFARGLRAANFRIDVVNPDKVTNVDCIGCADMTFYRGGADSTKWWQWMEFNGSGQNYQGSNGGGCGDTRYGTAQNPKTYGGSSCSSTSTMVYIQTNNIAIADYFGSEEVYVSGDTLLFDVVAGNRNTVKYYNFYSIKDGNWSDPTTWSTVSYTSNVNAAATDPDPRIRPVPMRQYDNVYIGNGKKVKLDIFVGTNVLSQYSASANDLAGPSTYVEKTGTLDLNTTVYRGNQFNAKIGSTIIVGSNDGIINVKGGIGNVQMASYTGPPNFSDSINIVYAPNGRTLNLQQIPLVNRNSSTYYIQSVTIRKASDNSIVLQYTSGDKFLLSSYGNIRSFASGTLNVGEQYYIEIVPSNTSNSRRYKAWLDNNYDYTFSTQLSDITSSNNNLVTMPTFTVPANMDQGTAFLRIGMSSSTTNYGASASGTGEFEDYAVFIKNPIYVANQVTGTGLPNILSSFTVNSPNPATANPQVTLGKSIIVTDSIKFMSGSFYQGSNNITLFGDFIHDTLNGYNQQTGLLSLQGGFNQLIRGKARPTFGLVEINKIGTSKVYQNITSTFTNNLNFLSDNNWVLRTTDSLIFGTNAAPITSGTFSKDRMIEVDGNTTNSYVIKQLSVPSAQDTTLAYCTVSLSAYNVITRVRYGSLDNSSGASGYTNFTSSVSAPTITAGLATPVTLNYTNYGEIFYSRIWIDYNQDGVFDNTTELAFSGNNSGTSITGNITIPTSALNGITRMRIKFRQTPNNTNPCETSNYYYGEYEDYNINITGGVSKPTNNLMNFSFLFPIGTNGIYNSANFVATSSFSANPYIAVQLREGKHPQRLNDFILNKYWRVNTGGISNLVGDSLKFQFANADTNLRFSKYIPSRYDGSWEINLGTKPKVTDNFINIKPTTIDTIVSLNGDWTAGYPSVFFNGRRFWSRNTGDWNNSNSWSNVGHTGPISQYFPGDLFIQDTVHIDGHTITFKDTVNITIDSLIIGGTNTAAGQGKLVFGLAPITKSLSLRQISFEEDGMIDGLVGGGRQDTIRILQNFRNNSTSSLTFRNDSLHATHLKFYGSGNALLYGTGNFGRLGNLILEKNNGWGDTLFIPSLNFAKASDTTQNYAIYFKNGLLYHNVLSDLYISSKDNDVIMEDSTGIVIMNGSVRSKSSIISNMNTLFLINGGDFLVGDYINESFYYRTGTLFQLYDGKVEIAGGFTRFLNTSLVDFTMNGNNTFKVGTKGITNSNIIGFDISNSASSFSMSNGRIVLANANGTTPSAADYINNAINGTGMTNGVLQSGDTTLTPTNTLIKIAGSRPVYNLHFANNPTNAVETKITEPVFTIANNWELDVNHSFNLSGNTVRLAGNLTNYGTFVAVPTATTSNIWQFELNGIGNQILFSNQSNLEFYKFTVNKPTGKVTLSSLGSSNVIIRNNLEFSTINQSFIDASATNRYVELSPTSFSPNPLIYRLGLGHVYGRLYRYVTAGNTSTQYPVGADTITSYRPLILETVGTDGTAGLVGVYHYPQNHPDVNNSGFTLSTNIEKYWNVNTASTFNLGSRTFNVSLRYIKPYDLRGGVNPFNFEMFEYSPAYPATGTWKNLYTVSKNDTAIKSINNLVFGDFAIGEPAGTTFYSYNNGSWNDVNTWSLDGYLTKTTTVTRPPNDKNDIIRIGNGKIVTLPNNFNDTVRTVIVERFNNLYGELYIEGDLNYIRGNSFILNDSCTLGIQHLQGITASASGNTGAIQTNSRVYGISRYVYNSNIGSTASGYGLPDTVKSLIIDLKHTINKSLLLNMTNQRLRIQDSLQINQGIFSPNIKTVSINKVLELNKIINNGQILPDKGKFVFPNNSDKYIVLKNITGANFYNLELSGGNLIVKRPVAPKPDSSHIYIDSLLNFAATKTKLEINDNVNVVIKNSLVTSIQNFNNQNFVRIGTNGGLLIRNIAPSLTYTYPIGINNDYNYATYVGLTGNTGHLGIRVAYGTGNNLAHKGSSGISTSSYINKYWTVDSVKLQINGKLRFNYLDGDIVGTETNIIKIGRWNPTRETIPGNWTFPFNPSIYDYNNNYFETSVNFAYADFKGDWAFGTDNYYRRLFYSRQSGNWNDPNTWTASATHTGPIYGAGLWPNLGFDSVTIGGGINGVNDHIVVLNLSTPFVNPTNVGITVGTSTNNTGTLDLGANILNGNKFNLRDLSTIKIGSPLGITVLGNNTGNIITDTTRYYSKVANYHYNGNVNQVTGNGLPNIVNKLVVQNVGASGSNTVALTNSVNPSDSLAIYSGRLDVGSLYNVNTTTVTAKFEIYPNAVFAIGGNMNMSSVAAGYNSYNLDDNSYVEFYGNNQIINLMPTNMTQSFTAFTGGFGNIITTEAGAKTINAPLLIRGNLINRNNSSLTIDPNIISVRVLKDVINSASIFNQGVIELGK